MLKARILLVNPWVHDFAAYNFWARPLGLLQVAGFLSAFDVALFYIDCMDRFDTNAFGCGKYPARRIEKPEILRDLARFYKRYGIGIDEFSSRLHARFIDHDLALLMKTAGFRTIRLSLETIDPVRQQQTGGKVAIADFEKALIALRSRGFTKKEVGAYLMYGLPGQALAEVKDGIRFLKDLNVTIHLAEFSPIKGTAAWEYLVNKGIIPDNLDPLLTNNTVFSDRYSQYDRSEVEKMKFAVKEYNALQ